MCRLEGNKEHKHTRGRFHIEGVEPTESEVGVECRGITVMNSFVDSHTQIDGELGVQTSHCPGLLAGLPGRGGQVDHFFNAPSSTRGVSKSPSLMPGTRRNMRALLKCERASAT